jgi:hypothetical protein
MRDSICRTRSRVTPKRPASLNRVTGSSLTIRAPKITRSRLRSVARKHAIFSFKREANSLSSNCRSGRELADACRIGVRDRSCSSEWAGKSSDSSEALSVPAAGAPVAAPERSPGGRDRGGGIWAAHAGPARTQRARAATGSSGRVFHAPTGCHDGAAGGAGGGYECRRSVERVARAARAVTGRGMLCRAPINNAAPIPNAGMRNIMNTNSGGEVIWYLRDVR